MIKQIDIRIRIQSPNNSITISVFSSVLTSFNTSQPAITNTPLTAHRSSNSAGSTTSEACLSRASKQAALARSSFTMTSLNILKDSLLTLDAAETGSRAFTKPLSSQLNPVASFLIGPLAGRLALVLADVDSAEEMPEMWFPTL